MKRSKLSLISFILSFLTAGCAALQFQAADINFPYPFFAQDFSNMAPNGEEVGGVTLRFNVPESRQLRYTEQTIMFARTKKGRGLRVILDMERTERFLPGRAADSFVKEAETAIRKDGKIYERAELSALGELIEFFEGKHETDVGKFEVMNMKRSPVFPEGMVRVGDTWSYDEEMTLKLHSFWVKQKKPSMHKMKAQSELKGFITMAGRRVAVIHTQTEEKSTENLSIFFKGIQFDIVSQIEEITYFDYKSGKIIQKVVNTASHTTVPRAGISDEGKSQTVSRLILEQEE